MTVIADYKSMYFHLTGKLTNAIDTLDKLSEMLKDAQREEEEIFIADNEMDSDK